MFICVFLLVHSTYVLSVLISSSFLGGLKIWVQQFFVGDQRRGAVSLCFSLYLSNAVFMANPLTYFECLLCGRHCVEQGVHVCIKKGLLLLWRSSVQFALSCELCLLMNFTFLQLNTY